MNRTVGKAQRLTALREELERRPRSVVELAEAHGCNRRTIERDLVTLAELMGVELVKGADHRYHVPGRPTALNEVEALAVYSATRLLLHTGVGERHYRTALEKLARQVPETARRSLLAGVDDLKPAPEDRVLDLVAQAWFQQRVLRCTYESANSGTVRPRDLQIYFFELNRRNLEPYVLAYDATVRKGVAMFKLARMSQVSLRQETYEIPAGFDPMAELGAAFGIVVGEEIEIVLHVSERVARRMGENFDRNLRVAGEVGPDRWAVHVTGTVDSHGQPLELLPWLLSWGASVEVVEPDHVRERVQDELRRALTAYGGAG